jgi:hypothetical protein
MEFRVELLFGSVRGGVFSFIEVLDVTHLAVDGEYGV